MCDYSLQTVRSRKAVVGDRLRVTNFQTGTRGFSSDDDPKTAVCVLPGTELAFDEPGRCYGATNPLPKVARFGQVRKDEHFVHHDMLLFPDGVHVLLNAMIEGQMATVLQLPAEPKNAVEREEQRRAEYVS